MLRSGLFLLAVILMFVGALAYGEYEIANAIKAQCTTPAQKVVVEQVATPSATLAPTALPTPTVAIRRFVPATTGVIKR